jgi:hypothetical protein
MSRSTKTAEFLEERTALTITFEDKKSASALAKGVRKVRRGKLTTKQRLERLRARQQAKRELDENAPPSGFPDK